jgi:transketolase
LISTGGTLAMTMKAADELAAVGISVSVLSMPSLAPFDKDAVLRAAKNTGRILTVENHGLGGLGSSVAEVLAASPLHPRFAAMYLQATPIKVAGSEASMYATHNLSAAEITSKMKSLIVS